MSKKTKKSEPGSVLTRLNDSIKEGQKLGIPKEAVMLTSIAVELMVLEIRIEKLENKK
jgi:hypothetical protein